MSKSLRKGLVVMIVAAMVLAVFGVAGCKPATDTGKDKSEEPVVGGTLTIGYEQEPAILNPLIEGGDMMATKDVLSQVLLGLVRIKPDFTYEPMLAEEIPTVENGGVTENPFTVTWKIKEEAVWSDGTPVSADDVKFTYDTIMSDKWKILSKAGYEDVEKCEVVDPKTVKFTFKKTVATYREWMSASSMVMPKHALDGKDFNTVLNESVPVASGPFVFEEWKKGDHITLARNDKFWGENKSYLDKVVFKWVPDTNTEMAQMKTGEVQAINPSPDVSLIPQLEAIEGVDVQADPGTIWEHLAFQFEKPDVGDVKVRQAIAYSIDRQKIADEVMAGTVKPLNDIFVPEQADFYSAAWEVYKLDKTKADALFTEAGYAKGADGFWAKDGKKLTLEFKTTAGNKGREKMFQILQAQLKDAGVDVKLAFEDAQIFFGESTTNGNFQVGEWAWLASPDPSVKTLFSAEQLPPDGQNYYRYKNAEVTAWINEADASLDMAERAEISRKISAQMAKDVPLIPLYQRLSLLAVTGNVHGAENNPTLEGVFWNLGDWWMDAPAAATK